MTLALAAPPDPDVATVRRWLQTAPSPDPVPPVTESYHFTAPALEHLLALAEQRPGVVDVEIIGASVTEAPLVAFHVRDPTVAVDRHALIVAGLHAEEWIGTQTALALAEEHIRRPVSGLSLTVVPLANPDGRAKVERDLLAGDLEAYRRGNQVPVDLNRDFAEGREAQAIWRHAIPARYATSPGPLSQPESRALDALATSRPYDLVVSLHAFGGYLYHPWASRWERPDDWAAYVEAGRCMEKAQGAGAYRTRQLGRWGFFFRAHGTELDHFAGSHGVPTWLIEITRSGIARPRDRKTPFRWYNPRRSGPHVRRALRAIDAQLVDSPCRIGHEQAPDRP